MRAREMKFAKNFLKFAAALLVAILVALSSAQAAPIKIVAVGASNTLGWGVSNPYPVLLERMLRQKGIDAEVSNAGMILDTTGGMLSRIDAAVPDGTRLVILQPGGNDLRFFRTRESRVANIEAIVRRLHQRHIKVIVFDPVIPPQHYQWDRIHLNSEGHASFAAKLLPQVIAALRNSH